ncbi:STAS domain-containing protein [Pigmentiphaga aceris]|uniref:STAS domain-containing protein n=1 Tax=Pigmentiphaga aceris TaxID=1940612 RepID=A0A5C0AW88_9BURK|nr:STAS domain-containing protein [Pigmentiphaga aceris]QEI05140.1 STAS domain-containing protein [Pigmentiphaga aceris]
MSNPHAALAAIIEHHQATILNSWLQQQLAVTSLRRDPTRDSILRDQSAQFLGLFIQALKSPHGGNFADSVWDEIRELLKAVSRSRVQQGFTPSETATFVFSLKELLFTLVLSNLDGDSDQRIPLLMQVSSLLDQLGLYTTEVYQQSREQIIGNQQQELLELSTPVVSLYDGILALPLIGTLDSERTQIVMENLLQGIVNTEASIAIIDITGVPTVDTLVAQHLLKTVAAARLMGAECIISGIRPQIAQTIVHLGVDLGGVATKATLADAFKLALKRRNLGIYALTK